MKVLVIGSGAREHALVWKLTGERAVSEVICAPGNPGIATIARCLPVDAADPSRLLALASHEDVGVTVVGPELPLANGIVDLFLSQGRSIAGPTRDAARLESSKVFAKEFMARHNVPTARYDVCEDAASAHAAVDRGRFGFPVVVKADGLAAGKGVVVAPDRQIARAAVDAAMVEHQFGDAGSRIVIEECLQGPEASFFVLADGQRAVPLSSAQDHKRLLDDDRGPNTGGMGAFAPSPLLPYGSGLESRIMREIVEPTLQGMRDEGCEYRGFLYVGLMITGDGPRVIEFNARFGDPEAQVVLPMIDSELLPLLMAAASGDLRGVRCEFRSEPHVGVVVASGGYPGRVESGKVISGIERAEQLDDVMVFQAGTARRDGQLVTSGGRVLTVVGRGADYAQAAARAYAGVEEIQFDGMQYRRDIGKKAIV